MKAEETKKDSAGIAIVIGVLILGFAFFADALSDFTRYALVSNVILSYITAVIGKERKIGFSNAFFVSLLLSTIVGFIVVLSSPRITDERYKEKILELTNTSPNASSIADQLHKLNELRKDGVLTEDEFTQQKEKLLNA